LLFLLKLINFWQFELQHLNFTKKQMLIKMPSQASH